MPPNTSTNSPLLSFYSWQDWSPIDKDERGGVPLWFGIMAKGPYVGGAYSNFVKHTDCITLETVEGFTDKEYEQLRESVINGDRLQIPCLFVESMSEISGDPEWEYFGVDDVVVELSTDAHSRLKIEVEFNDAGDCPIRS